MIYFFFYVLDILNNATKYGKIDSYLKKFNPKGYAILHKCGTKSEEDEIEARKNENVQVNIDENVKVVKDDNVEDKKDDSIEVIYDGNGEVNQDESIEVIDESESESEIQVQEIQKSNVESGENAEMKQEHAMVDDSKSEHEDELVLKSGEAKCEADDEIEKEADENEEVSDEYDESDDEPPNVHSTSFGSNGPAIGFRCSIL